MKNIKKLITFLLAYMSCSITYAQIYTPNCTSVEYSIKTQGDIETLESNAAIWLSARGWTNDVIKTAPATGEYILNSVII